MAHRIAPADGHRHLVHLCGRGDRHRGPARLWGRGGRGARRRPARSRLGPHGPVLGAVRASGGVRCGGHVDWVLAAFRGRRKLRRRIRRAGFRQLAESHARHGLVGRLPCVPTAHERRGQAAFRAVRSGGGLPAGTVLRQSGFHRIRASAGGEPAHVHAVQAGIRLGCHHLDRFALRRLVRRSAGRYRGADQGRPRPYPPPRGRRLAPSPATA